MNSDSFLREKQSKSVEDLYEISESDFDTPRRMESSQSRLLNNEIVTETQSVLVKRTNTDRNIQTNSRAYAVNPSTATKRDPYKDIHKKVEKKPYVKSIILSIALFLLIGVGILLLVSLNKKDDEAETIPDFTNGDQISVVETIIVPEISSSSVTVDINQVEPTTMTMSTTLVQNSTPIETKGLSNSIKNIVLVVVVGAVAIISIVLVYTFLKYRKSKNKYEIPNGMVAYLKLVSGDELISVRSITCKLGASSELCDQVLRGRYISKEHAQLSYRDGHFYLLDLGSRNGTFVNDVRINKNELKHLDNGCSIRFADVEYIFEVMYE